jgi:hypothetical protein
MSNAMKKGLAISLLICVAFISSFIFSGCAYSFTPKGKIDDSIKTVKVNFIENRAPYINPQLSPTLTEKIRQKINNQTKLTQVNSDEADMVISGTIVDYSTSTVGITNQGGTSQSSVNRLTVTVQVAITKITSETPVQFSISRNFDFDARQTIQQVEAQLLDEIVRNMTDEIFNKLFSDW